MDASRHKSIGWKVEIEGSQSQSFMMKIYFPLANHTAQ